MNSLSEKTISTLAWSPIILITTYLGISMVVNTYFPYLYCSPVNPGGKEYVCGYEYSTLTVKLIINIIQSTYCALVLYSTWQAFNGKLNKTGIIGLILSVTLLLIYIILAFYFGGGDSP
jgi:hypothetical protein